MSWIQLACIGWALNIVGFTLHVMFCDKDPTHEDVVVLMVTVFCSIPYFVFVMVLGELFAQKILNYHHGVWRK